MPALSLHPPREIITEREQPTMGACPLPDIGTSTLLASSAAYPSPSDLAPDHISIPVMLLTRKKGKTVR